MIKIFNTLSRRKEEIKPLHDNKIGLYTCGPTVYSFAHIGNLRTSLFGDILKRSLLYNNFDVKHVMNITDVDDKTIKAAAGKKDDMAKLTKDYEEEFFDDLRELNIIKPDVVANATAYVNKMVAFIKDLMDKGFAYKSDDGSIYFEIDKFKDYGKLSHLDKTGIKAGARVNQDEYDKENAQDFVLWKAWNEKDGEIFWETELGKGRPGWHIECSTMAQDTLGETIDIHTGAVDLIFPHHENEIAQSEARSGKKFANYFVHGEHLIVDGKKMSKSLNNLYTLEDLKKECFSPLDFRYLVLGAHYRTKLNFSWNSLKSAQNSLNKLYERIRDIEDNGEVDKSYQEKFLNAINDDLDMPKALAIVWELLKSDLSDGVKKSTLEDFDKVLGLNLKEVKEIKIPEKIDRLSKEREFARQNNDWKKADEIRNKIIDLGYEIEDTKEGLKIKKAS